MRHAPEYYQDLARNAESMQRFNRVKASVIDWMLAGIVVACVYAIGGLL